MTIQVIGPCQTPAAVFADGQLTLTFPAEDAEKKCGVVIKEGDKKIAKQQIEFRATPPKPSCELTEAGKKDSLQEGFVVNKGEEKEFQLKCGKNQPKSFDIVNEDGSKSTV